MHLGMILSNTIGLLLLAASFVSLGLYVYSLTTHPVIAAAGTLGILMMLWIIDIVSTDLGDLLPNLSLLQHYEQFNRGMIDSCSLSTA